MKHIRILSPSGSIDPSYITQTSMRLRAWGFEVSEGAHARGEWGRFAGTDEERIADLNAALQDRDVDYILCARGGYGMQRIIDRIEPVTKPIIGFSDITALHQLSALNRQYSIHGIMCKHIATLPEESEPIVALRGLLAGEQIDYQWAAHPLNRSGVSCAPIIGGNLSVLYGLQGTRFGLQEAYSKKEFPILLIEDICERHYHIDRMIRNLKLSGVLAHLSGLIVGQFSDCEDDPSMGCTVYETIKEAVADYDYPVLFNAPVGHVEHNLPIRLHSTVRMEVTPEGVHITEAAD